MPDGGRRTAGRRAMWAIVGAGAWALCAAVWPGQAQARGFPGSSCAAQASTATQVTTWIVAGQSQATTFGMSRETLPFQWVADPRTQIWVWDDRRKAGRWQQYEPGVNSAPRGRWGPEAQMIRAFRKDHPMALLAIIKYAPGQTGVAQDPNRPDWNIHSRGEAWDRLAAMTDKALKTCRLTVDGLFWIGNHNDGMEAASAALVGVNMADLVRASRTRWGVGLPWIVGLPDDTPPYFTQVRRSLLELDLADPLMTSFDTYQYGTQADGLHYDAASVIQLGEDFYRARVRLAPPD